MAEIIKSEALILRSIRWHESSKIMHIYSREWGRLGLIAKGALRPKSPFAGNLETLNYANCIVSYKAGRELQILTGIDVIDSFSQMRLNLDRQPYALAVLEVLDQVLEGHTADAVFFDFTIYILRTIEKSRKPEMVFWYFLLKLVSFLGFRPQLKQCHTCHTQIPSGILRFNFSDGAVFCNDCAANSSGGMKLENPDWQYLRTLQLYPHRKLSAFEDTEHSGFNFTPLLIEYLNFHTEKNLILKSLQLLLR